jgi:hypothetical protein
MEKQEMGALLNNLMHLDRETARIYSEAIPTIGESDVAVELQGYRRDHARHADECFECLRTIGEPIRDAIPEMTDLVGMEDDAIENAGRIDTSLMALFIAEEVANLEYAQAMQNRVPDNVRQVISSHLDEDKQHLQYVRESLMLAADNSTAIRVGI